MSITSSRTDVRCSCPTNADGSVTSFLCPLHADTDPCLTMSQVTGRRRTGTIRRGRCTACGWIRPVAPTEPLLQPCAACNAEPGEPCRPGCLGYALDAREALLRAERDTYRKQWHQEVENFERETVRAEAAEARLRAMEAKLSGARGRVDLLTETVESECDPEDGICHGHDLYDGQCALAADLEALRAALASAAPAVSDGEGATSDEVWWAS